MVRSTFTGEVSGLCSERLKECGDGFDWEGWVEGRGSVDALEREGCDQDRCLSFYI